MTRFALLAAGPLCLVACATPQPENASIVAEYDLSGPDRQLVGVAVDPASGNLTVLDANEGLFEVTEEGLELLASPVALQRDGADLRPYTDLVALGDDEYVVTVRNDGLLVDVAEQLTTQHFCYLPGDEFGMVDSGPVVSQLTHAVTFNPLNNTLYAQPRTFEDGDFAGAQVGTYSRVAGGQPEGWFELKGRSVDAHGMIWDQGGLLMARGSELFTYRLGANRPEVYADLSHLGIANIEGMAIRADDTLVLALHNRVVEVSNWRL